MIKEARDDTRIMRDGKSSQPIKSSLRVLAALTEVDEVITSTGPEQLQDVWDRLKGREDWMSSGQYVFLRNL